MANEEKTSAQLQEDIEKRKAWFFECQLRRLYMEAFRDVTVLSPDKAMIDLVGRPPAVANPLGSRAINQPLVYRDSGKTLWTREEREQRSAFKDITSGTYGSWLYYGNSTELTAALQAFKSTFENSPFSSAFDLTQEENLFPRDNPTVAIPKPKDRTIQSHAISRGAIAARKPWLIPELFNDCDTISSMKKWIENGESIIADYAFEVTEVVGATGAPHEPFKSGDPEVYRNYIRDLFNNGFSGDKKNTGNAIKVSLIDESGKNWSFDIKISTPASVQMRSVSNYKHSQSVKYWTDACSSKIKEVCLIKSESDMGLCLLMRTLYLYGSLQGPSFDDKPIPWRDRTASFSAARDAYNKFFDRQRTLIDNDKDFFDKDPWKIRMFNVQQKLQILLEETAARPRTWAVGFSPIAEQVIKYAILQYKFWLDEPYRAYDYHKEKQDKDNPQGINKARKDIDTGEMFAEMEYWSENHYIMFASSEYLSGQLWPDDQFQPGLTFLTAEDNGKLGEMTGRKRMERGRARIMKWLNNKLMFGWTEFNSSGYYREHLWALLNLVDFALDEEINRKARIVVDLILFDVTRFLHKGSMGACGGRSQFASKNSGWDNALGDAIEIMLGVRGVFTNKDGEIGCSLATSTYRIPNVLLQIANYPPDTFQIDRCRVSIGFDDAPRYGIDISQKSDQFYSVFNAYTAKRLKHAQFLYEVNASIDTAHTNYGAWQDDTIFWWSQSAFLNKQVVRNTFKCVSAYKLEACKAFGTLDFWFEFIAYVVKLADIAGLAGGLLGSAAGLVPSTALFADDATSNTLEHFADDVSLFFDGSTRSRANIYTSHSRDAMLSSIQKFRTGQTNFQSNVNQATISTGVNVFTTAGTPGINISDLLFVGGGLGMGALGGSIVSTAFAAGTGGVITGAAALFGAIFAEVKNRTSINGSDIGEQGDGPGWWSGYWALPMVVQHENAAIIMYDFSFLQRRIIDTGSHVWFPKDGFTATKELPSGSGGYWIFGLKNHLAHPLHPDNDEQGYIGVFSNKSPDWQDKDSDFYKQRIKDANENALDKLNGDIDDKLDEIEKKSTAANNVGAMEKDIINNIILTALSKYNVRDIEDDDLKNSIHMDVALYVTDDDMLKLADDLTQLHIDRKNHDRTWANPLPDDFFKEKDWYAPGTNIWIIQVGSKKEYGSFENFKEKISSAAVTIDNSGDMECAYHMPKPDGSTQVLSVQYKGEIKLDGQDFQTDFYPRFENLFVRGGRVEWGQREWVIEYRGEKLLHDFSDMNNLVRTEFESHSINDAQTIKGLVIYLRTTQKAMEVFTVATATVAIGCNMVATDEVIAAGAVDKNNYHDAEWIFFDSVGLPSPYMTINIAHHTMAGEGADNTDWTMVFSLMALMGDRTLQPCTVTSVPSASYYFRDSSRTTGPIPFSVTLLQWRTWQSIATRDQLMASIFAVQARDNHYYYDHTDQFAIGANNILSHRTIGPCNAVSPWTELNRWQNQGEPTISAPYRLYAHCTQPGYCFLFVISGSDLYARWLTPGQSWGAQPWHKLAITLPGHGLLPDGRPDPNTPPVPVPTWPLSFIQATLTDPGIVEPTVYLSGVDGNIHWSSHWPLDTLAHWRTIDVASSFALLHTVPFQVTGNTIFALDTSRNLWQYPLDTVLPAFLVPLWEPLAVAPVLIDNFTTVANANSVMIIAVAMDGTVWSLVHNNPKESWQRVGQASGFKAQAGTAIQAVNTASGRTSIFVTGSDQKLYTTWWSATTGWENGHNWEPVAAESEQFNCAPGSNFHACCRVDGQVEIYATDTNDVTWMNWWS